MADRVITGALAIIRVQGVAIGKMKTVRVNENVQRAKVMGLGALTPDELPPTAWVGTLTCDFYNIDFSKSQIPGAIYRNAQTLQQWVDSVLLQEEGVTVDIFRKQAVPGSPTSGLIPSEEKPYAQIRGLFLDTESFDLNEGQVSGRNQSFTYLYPIIFPQ